MVPVDDSRYSKYWTSVPESSGLRGANGYQNRVDVSTAKLVMDGKGSCASVDA